MHFRLLRNNAAMLLLCVVAFAPSCKKGEPEEPDNPDPGGFAEVLRSGSGFRKIYTQAGGVALDIEVPTNTAELCVAMYDASEYMTGLPVTHVKVAAQTGAVIDAKRQLSDLAFPSRTYAVERVDFSPHTDSIYWTIYVPNSTGGYWNLSTEAKVIACTYYGYPRRSFSGEWVTTDGPNGSMAVMKQYPTSTNMGIAGRPSYKNALEPVNTTGDYLAVSLNADSAFAAFVTKADPYTFEPAFRWKTRAATMADFAQWDETLVRRSREGDRTGFCFRIGVPGAWRYYTFSSNNATKTVTLVHDGVALPQSPRDWTAYDIDPDGNMYYAGKSAAGGGTSIYKVAPGGTSTIGADNFLAKGSVELVRYAAGKVYLGITAYYKIADGREFPKQMDVVVAE